MVKNLPGQADLEYGTGVNHNLLEFMGKLHGTVFDVGCGAGAWGPLLRRAGADKLRGLEPTSHAQAARTSYDEVVECPVEQVETSFFSGTDALIFADVLEHLLDPWQVLRDFRREVTPGTDLYISVPNVQSFRIAVPLLTRGRFEYSDIGGPMDRGHLRWFTQATLRDAVTSTGWRVERQSGYLLGRVATTAMRLTRGAAGPIVYHQLHLHARAA